MTWTDEDGMGTDASGDTTSATETAPQPGMPNKASAVSELTFTPKSTKHTMYQIIRTDEMDPYDTPLARGAIAPLSGRKPPPSGDSFQGQARKAAKLSIPAGPVETFADLRKLIASLPSENRMKTHNPPITVDANSQRVAEEMRNVSVHAFLYAASRENDNDFHLIVGSDPNGSPIQCMTMELSGLPASQSPAYSTLKATRAAYKTFFGTRVPGLSYDFYKPPIPVAIEGSLFFDMTHSTGQRPGPPSLQPYMPTIWEVHPITRIVLGP